MYCVYFLTCRRIEEYLLLESNSVVTNLTGASIFFAIIVKSFKPRGLCSKIFKWDQKGQYILFVLAMNLLDPWFFKWVWLYLKCFVCYHNFHIFVKKPFLKKTVPSIFKDTKWKSYILLRFFLKQYILFPPGLKAPSNVSHFFHIIFETDNS